MSTPQPPGFSFDYAELIRSHRLYLGLSQRGMARALHKDRRDYQRIENGQDACPPGLLDRCAELADKFDTEVANAVQAAGQIVREGDDPLLVSIDPDDGDEWGRVVIGRAAVESGLLMPMLVGQESLEVER